MADINAFEVEMINPEADSTLSNMTTSSAQICSTELLDASIEDVRSKKKTMVSKIDSVISLMNIVEYEEKAAEQAKTEVAQSFSGVMLNVYELMDRQQRVKKKNDMLAREAYVQKKFLSTKMESLQLHLSTLLDKGDNSLKLLDDMSTSLELRLTSAIMKKKSAIKKKQENEAFARAALAYAETRLAKVEEESNRLKQEAVEISKLQEFLNDRGHLVTMLYGEISDKCRDLNRLKEELDQMLPPDGKMSSSRKSSIPVSSSSSLVSSIIPCQPQPEPANSDVLFRKGLGFGIKSPQGIADVTKHIKNVKIKGKLHGYQLKLKGKLYANQMFAKPIKKVKIKGLQEYQMFVKSMKKVKIKHKLHGNEMIAKSIKKVKIKGKLHGNQTCAKSIYKLKIKGKHDGSKICVKSIKKLKIKGKHDGSKICVKSIKKSKIKGIRHGCKMCAKSIKNLKIRGGQHGSQMYGKSIKKVNIKSKLHGNQLCPKSVDKMKIKGKQQGCQMCVKGINRVKIKGLIRMV